MKALEDFEVGDTRRSPRAGGAAGSRSCRSSLSECAQHHLHDGYGCRNVRGASAPSPIALNPWSVRSHQIDMADAEGVTIVGFLLPFFSPLMYCWLKPEISASCFCVKPAFFLILRAFRPTSLRAPCEGQQVKASGFMPSMCPNHLPPGAANPGLRFW